MKLPSYFSHAAEKALAVELARQLLKDLPPSLIEKRLKLLSVNKVTKLLERIYRLASDHQTQHRIGFIKRASLANAFKWELKNNGYGDDFVEMATEGLVVSLSKTKAEPAATNEPDRKN